MSRFTPVGVYATITTKELLVNANKVDHNPVPKSTPLGFIEEHKSYKGRNQLHGLFGEFDDRPKSLFKDIQKVLHVGIDGNH